MADSATASSGDMANNNNNICGAAAAANSIDSSNNNNTTTTDDDDCVPANSMSHCYENLIVIDAGANLTNKKYSRDLDSVVQRAKDAGEPPMMPRGGGTANGERGSPLISDAFRGEAFAYFGCDARAFESIGTAHDTHAHSRSGSGRWS